MLRQFLVGFTLRLGLTLPLLYFAVYSFFRPLDVAPYYPTGLVNTFNEWGVTFIGGVLAIILGAWLISKKKKFYSNLTMLCLVLLAVVTNYQSFGFFLYVTPIICICISLFIRDYPRVRVVVKKNTSSIQTFSNPQMSSISSYLDELAANSNATNVSKKTVSVSQTTTTVEEPTPVVSESIEIEQTIEEPIPVPAVPTPKKPRKKRTIKIKDTPKE